MNLVSPAWLSVAALSVVVLLLHMRRRRQVEVPSLMLWRLLENSAASRRVLRRPPASLLLLLQLAFIALAAVALAQPQFGVAPAATEHIVYVLDASGSMRATDVVPTRFEAAQRRLAAMIAAATAHPGTRVSVVNVDAQPRIAVARQARAQGILPLVGGLQASDAAANWDVATTLVDTLLRVGESTRIVVLTDSADASTSRLEERFPGLVQRVTVAGEDAANVGLDAVIARADSPAAEWIASGTVRFSGREPEEVLLEARFRPDGATEFLSLGTTRVARRGGGQNVPFDIRLSLPGAGALQLHLPDDAGPHDNDVHFVVAPAPARARLLYLGDPVGPLLVALQSLDGIDLVTADRLPADDRSFDLVVVDNIAVSRRPATKVLWLGAAHLASRPPPLPLTTAYVTGWDTTHPLSDQVDWTALAPNRAWRVERLAGSVVLAEASGIPVAQARSTQAGREIQLAFDLAESGWASQPGLPIFVGNLMRWLGLESSATAPAPCVVGTPCLIPARFLGGHVATDNFLMPGAADDFVPLRAGMYEFRADGVQRTIAVNATAAGETALAPLVREGPLAAEVASPARVWWWILLAAVVVLLAEAVRAGLGSEQFLSLPALAPGKALAVRRRVQLCVRLAALGFAFAALAGLPLPARDAAENVVMVVAPDLDDTHANPARGRLVGAVSGRLADEGRNGGTGVVVAGGLPEVAVDLGVRDPRLGTLAAATPGTDLEAAVALAAAMLPNDRHGRIVVVADGNETSGQVARSAAVARARGIAVDVEPITEMPPGEVLVESVHAPLRVYLGDTFLLDAVITAQAATRSHVTILQAGEIVLEQDLDLLPGRNRVETVVPARASGNLVLEVSVTSARDTFVENNRNGVIVAVGAPPSVAVLTPDPVAGEVLVRALAVQGLSARLMSPSAAPKKTDGWLAHDAVVTMNLPAIALDTEQQESLEQFVHRHGRGLLILGGENSFGPGGYFGTAFERLSPLSSRIPHETPKVAIVFVLDRSGSMTAWADAARTATRLDIAKEATLVAVGQLPDEARVGIVAFDHEANILLPLQQEKDAAAVEQALGALTPGGGTFIYPGLAAAVAMLAGADVTARHIVVMTDGLSQTADFTALFDEARRLGITMSAIAVSSAADPAQPLLIAEGGGGGFYRTDDVRALPSILLQETLMLASAPLQRTAAAVHRVDQAGFLQGLPDPLPPVQMYVRTTLQPGGTLHLAVTDERGETEPLLASWRYGNGRVLAFATHGAGTGTADWLQLPAYPLLWAQAVRQFLPDANGPGLWVTLLRSGDSVRVTADALDKTGAAIRGASAVATTDDGQAIPMREVAAGRYEAVVTLPSPGRWRVDVAVGGLSGAAELYAGYPTRYDFSRADFDKLRALAGSTGGQLLIDGVPAFGDSMRWVSAPGWRIWMLTSLALFLLDLTIRYAPYALLPRRAASVRGPGAGKTLAAVAAAART